MRMENGRIISSITSILKQRLSERTILKYLIGRDEQCMKISQNT